MKKNLLKIILASGWVLLAVFLLSGYFFNKFSPETEKSHFRPVAWADHMKLFDGAIQCSLLDDELLERKKALKQKVFSKVTRKVESKIGITYYFEGKGTLLKDALEFVQKEKACCPFFKFDISILPYDQGFAIQISGSEAALDMLKDFETNEV